VGVYFPGLADVYKQDFYLLAWLPLEKNVALVQGDQVTVGCDVLLEQFT
jgi:hypothetical protein